MKKLVLMALTTITMASSASAGWDSNIPNPFDLTNYEKDRAKCQFSLGLDDEACRRYDAERKK